MGGTLGPGIFINFDTEISLIGREVREYSVLAAEIALIGHEAR